MIQSVECYVKNIVREKVNELLKNNHSIDYGRRKLVIANWKMNLPHEDITQFLKLITDIEIQDSVVICPPYPYLLSIKGVIEDLSLKIALGAQNVHWEEKGAYTGEVSATMLENIGCEFVIVGHSERRMSGETNEMINRKVVEALSKGIQPIICVGETKQERELELTNQVVKKQVTETLAEVNDFSRIVIAYEPIWAIGTGESATPEQAVEVHKVIRTTLEEISGNMGKNVPILYGGSVKASNARKFGAMEAIDGVLVGGASLVVDDFKSIIQAFV